MFKSVKYIEKLIENAKQCVIETEKSIIENAKQSIIKTEERTIEIGKAQLESEQDTIKTEKDN